MYGYVCVYRERERERERQLIEEEISDVSSEVQFLKLDVAKTMPGIFFLITSTNLLTLEAKLKNDVT